MSRGGTAHRGGRGPGRDDDVVPAPALSHRLTRKHA